MEQKEDEMPYEDALQSQFGDKRYSDEEEHSDSSDDDVEGGRQAAPPEVSQQSQRKATLVPQQQQQQHMGQSQQRGNSQQQQQMRQSQQQRGGPPQQQKGGPPQQQRLSQQRQGGSQQQEQRRGPPPPGSRGQPPRGEKNNKFQDVDNTGRWGNISKKEMIIVAVALLAIVGGVIAAVVLLVGGDSESTPPPIPPTAAPSIQPEVSPDLQMPVIFDAIKNNNDTNTALSPLLPEDLLFYTSDKIGDKSQPPSVRAISWILNEDPRDPGPDDPWLVIRYAIVSMYFAMAGEGWTKQTNWLSEDHACMWYGIICDRFNNIVTEVDLTNNNLMGSIPPEIALLTDLRSVVMQRNGITGTIPSETLGNMPVLSILFLNDNKLQGDLVELEPLRDNGILSTMFIQQNNITGRWPRDFCPRSGQPPVFTEFGLDCGDLTRCLCCTSNNCY